MNYKRSVEKNKNSIKSKVDLLEKSEVHLPMMKVSYRRLLPGIQPSELRDPEFYGIPDKPYEIKHRPRAGFILDVFDRTGEKTDDGGTIFADISRDCVVFDISLMGIYHASFSGDKEQPIPIFDENIGYGSSNAKDWLKYFEKIMERLNI